jgi:flagellar basal body-associated protein FliL
MSAANALRVTLALRQTVQLDAFFVNLQTTVYVRMKLRIQVRDELWELVHPVDKGC